MVFLFTLAISIDGFMVGLAYGIQNVVLRIKTITIISFLSAAVVLASMLVGKLFLTMVPVLLVVYISAGLLAMIGIWLIIQAFLAEPKSDLCKEENDFNQHAFTFGLVLALDSIAGGFVVALAGLPLVLTTICAFLISFFLILLALWSGRKFRASIAKDGKINTAAESFFSYLPGICIVLVAFWKLLE